MLVKDNVLFGTKFCKNEFNLHGKKKLNLLGKVCCFLIKFGGDVYINIK